MQEFPQITLDTTLAELYSRDGPLDGHGELAPTSRFARNTKFLYQDSTFSKTPDDITAE